MSEQESLVCQIMRMCREQAGPMPDEEAHKRYLHSLTPAALRQRAAWIVGKSEGQQVQFWTGEGRRADAAGWGRR